MEIGDKIRIIDMKNEPQYAGKEGVIKEVGKDCYGDLFYRGTWGGCSVYPRVDKIEKIG